MDVVERPGLAPGHCMASLKSEDPLGFLDTGLTPPVVDPRVYISISFVQECARRFGWFDPDARADCERLTRQVADLELQLAEADRQLTAIDLLESSGFTARKKTGRPPRKKEPEHG